MYVKSNIKEQQLPLKGWTDYVVPIIKGLAHSVTFNVFSEATPIAEVRENAKGSCSKFTCGTSENIEARKKKAITCYSPIFHSACVRYVDGASFTELAFQPPSEFLKKESAAYDKRMAEKAAFRAQRDAAANKLKSQQRIVLASGVLVGVVGGILLLKRK